MEGEDVVPVIAGMDEVIGPTHGARKRDEGRNLLGASRNNKKARHGPGFEVVLSEGGLHLSYDVHTELDFIVDELISQVGK